MLLFLKSRSFNKYFSLLLIASTPLTAETTSQKELFTGYGVTQPVGAAKVSKEAGATIITIPTDALIPADSEEKFSKNLEKLKSSDLPILASNGFIRPANLRCVGEDANHDEVLKWAETVFSRIKQVNGKLVIFGSGGSRKLNNGWTKEKADVQFVELLKKMGPLAQKHGITIALEQLNSSECNYINTITEAATIVRAANHPNIRLLADLYHMAKEGDTPEDLKAAADLLVHVEIAEKKGRTYPGVAGDDFKPFFRVLRDAGYTGAISIEGSGKPPQLVNAIIEIKKQAAEVMAEK
jgi:sugar phosphate isomerase/epimerase